MDYHLVLIVAEVLDWVTLTGVAAEGWNRELLGNSYSNMTLEKGELDASVAISLSLP